MDQEEKPPDPHPRMTREEYEERRLQLLRELRDTLQELKDHLETEKEEE